MSDQERAKLEEACQALVTAADAIREVRGVAAGGILVMIESLIDRCRRLAEERGQ